MDSPGGAVALYGVFLTAFTALVKQWLDGIQAQKMRELDIEEKVALHLELKRNTELTKQGIASAQVAYTEANNVNAKIAQLNEVQARLLEAQSDPEKMAGLVEYVHDRVHDLANHIQALGAKKTTTKR